MTDTVKYSPADIAAFRLSQFEPRQPESRQCNCGLVRLASDVYGCEICGQHICPWCVVKWNGQELCEWCAENEREKL